MAQMSSGITSAATADLGDDVLLAFVSDTHMGGDAGADLFEAHAELASLFHELGEYPGPVELVLAGDIFDLLRIGEVPAGENRVSFVLGQPAYAPLIEAWRTFAAGDARRVTYLPGNHDVEVWWNDEVRSTLQQAGLVHEFALAYAARYRSVPDRLIFCEHGNQLDRSNARANYDDPLESPLGDHVVADVMRPIAPRAHLMRGIPLRDVQNVYPLTQVPEWLTGRLFYDLLGRVASFVLLPMLVLFLALLALAWLAATILDTASDESAIEGFFAAPAAVVVVLLLAFVLTFSIVRRVLRRSMAFIEPHLAGVNEGAASLARIEALKDSGQPVPNRPDIAYRDIGVFVWAHSHAPSLTVLEREADTAVAANTGCWLRQLQPVRAHLRAPPVFVSRFVLTHVRVRRVDGGLRTELWEHARQAPQRLLWPERLAILGRLRTRGVPEGPRLVRSAELPGSVARGSDVGS
jgi:UDP-2,3-diacylglucosamine pyrophosphatase LpxH